MSLRERRIYLLISCLICIYLALRAIFAPMVHDETATFFHYIHSGKFLPYIAHWDANNHFLNSLLGWVSYHIFGSSEWVIRLPNLLFAPIFFYFVYRIAALLSDKYFRWEFIIFLLFAHYFIEFFAFARGYGMSMALLFGGVWYLIQSLETKKLKHHLWSLCWLSIACFANLSLFNTLFFVFVFLSLHLLLQKEQRVKLFLIFFLLGLIPIVCYTILGLELKDRGLLYYGGDEFWKYTVETIIKCFTGEYHLATALYVILLLVVSLGLILRKFMQSKANFIQELFNSNHVFIYLFFANLMATLLLGWLFEVNYPEDRVGLYFYPFFIGSVTFSAQALTSGKTRKILLLWMIPLLFFPIHFLYNLNLSHANYWGWKIEKIPHRYIEFIQEDTANNEYPPSIGGYRLRILSWAYQNFRTGGNQNGVHYTDYPSTLPQYQIVDTSVFETAIPLEIRNDKSWLKHYDLLDHDPYSELSLLKRKSNVQSKRIKTIQNIGDQGSNNEYFELFRSDADSLRSKNLRFDFDVDLVSDSKPFIGRFVISVSTHDDPNAKYEYLQTDWSRTDFTKDNGKFKNSLYVHNIPADAKQIVLYLWNIDQVERSIYVNELTIHELEE